MYPLRKGNERVDKLAFCNKCGIQIGDEEQLCTNCIPADTSSKSFVDKEGTTVDLMNLPKGYILDNRFEVDQLIGTGGFAAVYKASENITNKVCAVKIFFDLEEEDEIALKKLWRETEQLQEMADIGIVQHFDLCLKTNIKYAIIEYVEAGNLEQLIARSPEGKLPEKETLKIARQIAKTLKTAHLEGFYHHDLKSSNILVTNSGDVKIMDFGINEALRTCSSMKPNEESKSDPGGTEMSSTGISKALGADKKKIDYSQIILPSSGGVLIMDSEVSESMQTNRNRKEKSTNASEAFFRSPEQIMGEKVGHETDIWSFGVILLQLLTGKICFTGNHQDEVLANIKRQLHIKTAGGSGQLKQYGSIDKIEYVSTRINDLISNCLKFESKSRIRNFGQILEQLSENPASNFNGIIAGPFPDMQFSSIPSGTFLMGAPATEEGSYDNERPQHEVTIQPFYMQTKPVTQAAWEKVMGTNPSNLKGNSRPVECVSWDDVQVFLEKLNAANPSRSYRLPSEAEWEYACRAGSATRFYTGNADSDLDGVGWYMENSGAKMHRVGLLKPNYWGLYDMSGNIWEWCSDIWKDDYIDAPVDGSTRTDGGDSDSRVLRGGSWNGISDFCRSAYRSRRRPSGKGNSIGFRLAFS
ncbi:MAG: SUMF1/EgtB/PvdO family nonheme iron enzyme [Calditrichaeota bacterium]|nr:SUMF1/EgtB/PvdO family nonheme iron enzyme [Calditrichota bacterium]